MGVPGIQAAECAWTPCAGEARGFVPPLLDPPEDLLRVSPVSASTVYYGIVNFDQGYFIVLIQTDRLTELSQETSLELAKCLGISNV
jgi:hypothetical protein